MSINTARLLQKQQNKFKRRHEMLAHLGNSCVRCGFSDWRALQIDHKSGGAYKELKQGLYGSSSASNNKKFYNLVMNDNGTKFQLLCANCNWIKRYENNEFRKTGNEGFASLRRLGYSPDQIATMINFLTKPKDTPE